MKYIDMHCDTLCMAFETKNENIFDRKEFMVDISRLKQAGALAQFFAVFVPPTDWIQNIQPNFNDDDFVNNLYNNLDKTIKTYPNYIAWAKNYDDMIKNEKEGKVSAFLSMEDGRTINGSFEKFDKYYDMGLRLVTFVWNSENCFGHPNSFDSNLMQLGLKDFGKQAIEYMNDKGILIDVSHLSDGGFWDAIKLSKKPIVASHSSCRALSQHPRNLTDDMIKALGNNGGISGINFCPAFVNPDINSNDSRLSDIAKHIIHMANKGGIECVAIGSDFDGISGNLDVGDTLAIQKIWDELLKNGMNYDDIEKVAYKNAQRVLKDVL